jgi:DNA polymerase-3 subunit beta
MKFTVTQKLLLAALKSVAPIAPSKATIPILEHVLFELQGQVLRITATDLNQTVVRTIPVNGAKNGAATFPAKTLVELIASLPSEDLSLAVSDAHKLTVSTEKGTYKISGGTGDEFPSVSNEDATVAFEVPLARFAAHIETVAFAVSTDELRPQLMGILIDVKEDGLRFVATDGHRLVKIRDASIVGDAEVQAIVPIKAMKFIAKFGHESETLRIMIGASMIRFYIGELTLYSKLIVGQYPNYERLFPKDFGFVVSDLDAGELAAMLRRAKIFANELTYQVSLSLGANSMRVDSVNDVNGLSAREQIHVAYNAESGEITIGCNADYFLEIVEHLRSERIDFNFKDANSALLFKPSVQEQDMEVLMLLMPIRLEQQ